MVFGTVKSKDIYIANKDAAMNGIKNSTMHYEKERLIQNRDQV